MTQVDYIVEGDTFDIWYQWNDKVDWKQGSGWMEIVGSLADMPVCISITLEKVNGYTVLFWQPTSQVVDYRLIEKWFINKYPTLWFEGRPGLHCDSRNFGHCLNHLRKLEEECN